MAAILIENQIDAQIDERATAPERRKSKAKPPVINEAEVVTELGVWLSGMESFLASGRYSFADGGDAKGNSDMVKEFRVGHSALLRIARLNAILLSVHKSEQTAGQVSGRELSDLAAAIRDSILISSSMVRSEHIGAAEWKAWSSSLADRLTHLTAFKKIVRLAAADGEQFLPAQLRQLINATSDDPEHAELALVLPRFGKVLKWLSVVGKMLEADEPLKPALLVFSSVNEQVQELIGSINNRLESFPDEEAAIFASLDAASYTASIELKKVYTQELAGLARLRPSPSIYARMETSYSLLSEGFQQMLIGFARLVDPKAKGHDLFPNFKTKLDESLVLRTELSRLAQLVQATEQQPEKQNIDKLQTSLREFMVEKVRFLFYKDTETVERFIEEILVTQQNKDLVPILHRFGAYLDTLFGQVNLRAVLTDHPFES